jgi:hypothetical protein
LPNNYGTLYRIKGHMKIFGWVALTIGLMLGVYALTMDVSVAVAAKNYGYGIETPAMSVNNMGLMAQRQNYLIFSGILSVVGAILIGFGAMAPKPPARPVAEVLPTIAKAPAEPDVPVSVTICPKCRFMGDGDATVCARCEAPLTA